MMAVAKCWLRMTVAQMRSNAAARGVRVHCRPFEIGLQGGNACSVLFSRRKIN